MLPLNYTDAELDAHSASLGWRVVAYLPANPVDVTTETALAMFGGDVDGGLRDLARLLTQPKPEQEVAQYVPSMG